MAVSLLGVGAAVQAPAQAQVKAQTHAPAQAPAHALASAHALALAHAAPAHLPGLRVVHLHRAYEARLGHTKPGRISGIVYPRGKAPTARGKARPRGRQGCIEPDCPVLYNNGPVQLTPHIYLLLWGPNWTTDPAQEATAQYLQNFYGGLGVRQPGTPKDTWSTIISQYGDSSGAPIFSQSLLAGTFHDTTVPPTGATQAQIAAEADAFATTNNITDLTDAQIVVATQQGTCPAGFFAPTVCGGSGIYCAWHSSSNEPYINLPYLLDAGTSCGENFVNSGPAGVDDGFSLVGGAEYADTITNLAPSGGLAPSTSPDPAWIDTGDTVSGGEVAQKCAFDQPFASGAPHGDVTLSTGSFAMQSLWSNDAAACVLSDTVTITSPGGQSSVAGSNVSLQLVGKSSAGYQLTWTSTPLPPGLNLSSTGLITGIPSTIGTYGVTVTATDPAGTSRGVSFIWTITAAGSPITGPNKKCLDDSGAGTTDGTKVDIWTCNHTAAQDWTFSHGALGVLGKCLADPNGGHAGSKLVILTCDGSSAQTWSHHSNNEYVLKLNGDCLTDPSNSSVNGTQVEIRACKNFNDQHWSLPS
jgi:hypothetical protein